MSRFTLASLPHLHAPRPTFEADVYDMQGVGIAVDVAGSDLVVETISAKVLMRKRLSFL